MSPKETKEAIEHQLSEISKELFNARSIREIQFLQTKLAYFKQRLKEAKRSKK
jgi:hypothetical protein